MNLDDNRLHIFTDGSSYSSPRRGGMGMIFVSIDELGKEIVEDFPPSYGYSGATNNQMELQACIEALKVVLKRDVSNFSGIVIHTDSTYVESNLYNARFVWSRQKWFRASGQPVLNAHQWKELIKVIDKVYRKHRQTVSVEWVKGHSVNTHNRTVDQIAKVSAKIPSSKKVSIVKVRRKKFNSERVDIGCVKVCGQRVSIYIVNDEFLREQKIYRYRYQVISKLSPFYKKIDFIYSELLLNAGHSYYVKLNDDNKFPKIVKVFKEIPKSVDLLGKN